MSPSTDPMAYLAAASWAVEAVALGAIALTVASRVRARSALRRLVNEHRAALVRKRFMLAGRDEYGVRDTSRWDREVRRFAERVVLPALHPRSPRASKALVARVDAVLRATVVPEADALSRSLAFVPTMSPEAFESWCADRLREVGWDARVTRAGADQGADVTAERDGTLLVVQCKLHRRPVGNKAVQEIHAARSHYRAHAAAVVSNAGFTPAARDLARTTGVHLVHHSEVSRLGDLASA